MNDLVPYGDMKEMAAVMAKSAMFGKTPEQMLALMLIAQAEGKHPAIAAQEYDVIQGRPALNSRSTLARFQVAGGKIQWIERSDAKCSAKFSHPQGGELTVEWTEARAAKAGLASKDMYKKYPAQMLSARVIAEGVRATFPACLSGLYIAEEVEDMDAMRNVTTTDGLDDVHDRNGNFAPAIDHGEPAKRGSGISTEMLALKSRLMNLHASRYPAETGEGEFILSGEEAKDLAAAYNPGGQKLIASENDLKYLKELVEKWEAIISARLENRKQLDEEAEVGFSLSMEKDGE